MYVWILQNAIVSGMLAATVAAVCRLVRLSPAVKHALWLIVLIKLVTPPVGRCPVPRALDESLRWLSSTRSPPGMVKSATSGSAATVAVAETAEVLPRFPIEHEPDLPSPDPDLTQDQPSAFEQGRAGADRSRLAWWLLATWLVGAVVTAGIQVAGFVRLCRFLRQSASAPDWLDRLVHQSAGRLRIRPPRAAVIPAICSPMVCSLGRPRLLWPARLSDRLGRQAQEAVLLHELAHLRRRDHWVVWLEVLAGVLWWFNPVYWYARRQIHENAELACDAWVVALLPAGRRAYAHALVDVAEFVLSAPKALPAVALGHMARRSLERRLTMIMRESFSHRVPLIGGGVIGLALLAVLPGWSRGQAIEGNAADADTKLTVAELPADFTAGVDELFAKWNRRDIPGCAVGIVHRGQVIYSKGFGSADLEYQVPNTPQTLFDVSVAAQSLTCVCLAMLMDEGKVSPDDNLRKFVPEMHPFDPPIRVQDMVRCRTGLWDQIAVPALVGWEIAPAQHPYTEADLLSLLAGQKTLPFQPGSQYRFSMSDYFLLGVIVKRVSGQSLAEFARQRVFAPLGMSRTFFEEDPGAVVEQRAVGHYKRVGDAWHLWRPTAYMVGGAGLKTCVEDLCRWDRNFDHNRLPGGKYVEEFFREGTLLGNRSCLDADAAIKENDPEARKSPPGQYRGLRRRQFTGNGWGISSAMVQFPDQEFTAICLSNNDEIAAWNMTQLIVDLALSDRLAPQASRSPAPAASELPTVELDEAELRDKVGAYRTKYSGGLWRITLQDGTLQLTDQYKATCRLRPLSATRFDPEGPAFPPSAQLVFSRPAPGSPWSVTQEWELPDNKARIEFRAVELVDPTPDQLKEYVGRYENDELAATYRLELRGGRLWLRVNSRRWEALDATVRDEFVHMQEPADIRIITFLRNENGEVIGLSIDIFGRLTGVRFTKR